MTEEERKALLRDLGYLIDDKMEQFKAAILDGIFEEWQLAKPPARYSDPDDEDNDDDDS